MEKFKYEKSTQFPAGTANRGIPGGNQKPSNITSCKTPLSLGGTNFPKKNASEGGHSPSIGLNKESK